MLVRYVLGRNIKYFLKFDIMPVKLFDCNKRPLEVFVEDTHRRQIWHDQKFLKRQLESKWVNIPYQLVWFWFEDTNSCWYKEK